MTGRNRKVVLINSKGAEKLALNINEQIKTQLENMFLGEGFCNSAWTLDKNMKLVTIP